jgi:hypothetical protein
MTNDEFVQDVEDHSFVEKVEKLDDAPTYTVYVEDFQRVGEPLTSTFLKHKFAIVEISRMDDEIFVQKFGEQEKTVTKTVTAFEEAC